MSVRGMRWAVTTGARSFLRYPVPSDRAEFVDLRRSSRAYLERWEPIPPAEFNAFGDDAFDREMARRKGDSEHRLLVCTADTGMIAGRISISAIERGPLQSARLGYWLGKPFAGRGLMSDAIRQTLGFCFETLGLHRVTANIQPTNPASRRVIRACGFGLEGYSPRYLKIRGRWSDHERWAITREDWRRGGAGDQIEPEPPIG